MSDFDDPDKPAWFNGKAMTNDDFHAECARIIAANEAEKKAILRKHWRGFVRRAAMGSGGAMAIIALGSLAANHDFQAYMAGLIFCTLAITWLNWSLDVAYKSKGS